MKEITRTSLPESVKYNGRTYVRDMERSNKHTLGQPYDKDGCIKVNVLSRNLRGKLDLHHKPYQPTEWVFRQKYATNQYTAVLNHDKGKTRVSILASGLNEATQLIMKHEGCPQSAITELVRVKEIETLKKGDFLRLPGKAPVYVFDGYNRFTKKYSVYKFDDVSMSREVAKGKFVEVDFEF